MTLFDGTKLPPAMTAVQEQVDDPDLAVFADAANAAGSDAGHPGDGQRSGSRSARPTPPSWAAADPTKTIQDAGKTINDAIAAAGG